MANWFNQVDATYRSDLKEFNELNFARFDAKLEQRFAEFRAEITQRFAESDARWERRLAELKISLIRWMFGLWTVGTLTILGTVLAILKL